MSSEGTSYNFSATYDGSPGDYMLVELPAACLAELQHGLSLSVTADGASGGNFFVCTGNETYSMEVVETSNSVLLAPGNATSFAQPREDIIACMPRHVELKRAVPNMRALIERLGQKEATRLDEWDNEACSELGCLEEELLAVTPVSLSEMRALLHIAGVVYTKGRWIQLSPQLVSQALVEIAATLCACDASIGTFDPDLLLRCSGAIDILRHVVSTHAPSAPLGAGDNSCVGLDARKCCVAHARHLLLQREIWLRPAFEEAWIRLCPPGVTPEIDWLVGHALLGEGGEAVRRLSPYDLPLPPAQRFQFLFKIKPRWRKEELEPYVSDIPPSLDKVLLKHTRVTRVQGPQGQQQWYSKRE